MVILFTILLLLIIPIFLLYTRKKSSSHKLPPGSLGIPIIGQSLHLLKHMKANTAEKWLKTRINKYGPVSKLNLFGNSTVFIHGQAANKFFFTSDSSTLSKSQPKPIRMILGDRSLPELVDHDHKRVRDALMCFLKVESLKPCVAKIDEEVKLHIQNYWHGKEEVQVLPLMKTLMFNILCSLLIGIERGPRRDELRGWLEVIMKGFWSIPLNLPFTTYRRSLKASANIRNLLKDLIGQKKIQLEENGANPLQDLLTCLVNKSMSTNEKETVTEKEILDNIIGAMIAGHEASAILVTFFVRHLANEPSVHAAVLQEHKGISKTKKYADSLTWEDLAKMKYTWKVAQEILRLVPPAFGGFRKTVRDVEYEGYVIPKGWQVFWVTSMTHMDETIFKDPEKFDPTRFDNSSSIPPYCYAPFGAGPRKCPANEFGKIEILVTVHYIVTHFTWKLAADNFFCRNPSPIPTKGLPIKISSRQ